MTSDLFKVCVNIPSEYREDLISALDGISFPFGTKYDRVFTFFDVTGTWRSLDGSEPFNGAVGEITLAAEIRIEFVISEDDVKAVINGILSVHPYEEPVIEITKLIDWRNLIDS